MFYYLYEENHNNVIFLPQNNKKPQERKILKILVSYEDGWLCVHISFLVCMFVISNCQNPITSTRLVVKV